MKVLHDDKDIVDILSTKLEERDLILASEQKSDFYENFEKFVVLLGLNDRSPNTIIQKIMFLTQRHNESLTNYLNRVERMAGEYKLALQISNESPFFTDTGSLSMQLNTIFCHLNL